MLLLLPNELLDEVAGFCDHSDLRKLSLVSKRFVEPARRRLFRKVYIGTEDKKGFIILDPQLQGFG